MQPVAEAGNVLPGDNRESRENRERTRRCDSALPEIAGREPVWQ